MKNLPIKFSMKVRCNWFQSLTIAILLALAVYVEWLIFIRQISQGSGLLVLASLSLAGMTSALWIYDSEKRRQTAKDEHVEAVSRIADFATDMYWETDVQGVVTEAGGRLMGELVDDASNLIGQHYLSLIKLDQVEMRRMHHALKLHEPYSDIQSVFRNKQDQKFYISLSATPRFDGDGQIMGYFGIGTNVTDRVLSARKLKHMAEHDMLTGLANRYRFSDQIKTDLRASKDNKCLCLLAIDLDGFKAINDELGHQAGDALLNLVGKRLRSHIRDQDWAARMGGDEFVVVSRGVANPMEACLLAARLTAKLALPYRIGSLEVQSTASIGIACSPMHAGDADTLMKCADLALYQAKADGRNCYRLYETMMAQVPVDF